MIRKNNHVIRHQWILWFYDFGVRDWPLKRGILLSSRRKAKKMASHYVSQKANPDAIAVYQRQSWNIRDPKAESNYIWYTDIFSTIVEYNTEDRSVKIRSQLTQESNE